jgi:hypothetical protein
MLDRFTLMLDGSTRILDGFTLILDGFTLILEGSTLILAGFTLILDGSKLILDGFTHILDGFTHILDGFTLKLGTYPAQYHPTLRRFLPHLFGTVRLRWLGIVRTPLPPTSTALSLSLPRRFHHGRGEEGSCPVVVQARGLGWG